MRYMSVCTSANKNTNSDFNGLFMDVSQNVKCIKAWRTVDSAKEALQLLTTLE